MKYLAVAAPLILVVALLLDDANARGGRGGGGRGGGSRGGRTGRTRSSKGGGGSSSKTRISKTTPITPTRFSSSVIKAQATPIPRTRLFIRFAAGYLVTRYILSKAPVYRGGFPVHGSYVSIPENRAVRLSSERVRLLDSNGDLCLGFSPKNQFLKDGIEKHLIELNTTVEYKYGTDHAMTIFGVNNTVSLEDIKEKDFTLTTRARYNVTVVDNTDCSQVEKQVNGTMVQLYEFNPNTANIANIDFKLLVTSVMLIGILNCFKYF